MLSSFLDASKTTLPQKLFRSDHTVDIKEYIAIEPYHLNPPPHFFVPRIGVSPPLNVRQYVETLSHNW